jgi:hypothetical protein
MRWIRIQKDKNFQALVLEYSESYTRAPYRNPKMTLPSIRVRRQGCSQQLALLETDATLTFL